MIMMNDYDGNYDNDGNYDDYDYHTLTRQI